jgi:hypothetical protein
MLDNLLWRWILSNVSRLAIDSDAPHTTGWKLAQAMIA